MSTTSYRARDNKRIHRIWGHMRERCYSKNCDSYPRYGGRGITVCDEWNRDFQAFCEWALLNGYEDGLTIDRIDNDEGYSPENCRWVSIREQQRNRRTNRVIEYCGEALTAVEWAERYGLNLTTLLKRLNSGWSIEDSLTAPLNIDKSSVHRRKGDRDVRENRDDHRLSADGSMGHRIGTGSCS